MSLLDPVNNYCERLGPSLLAEPLNAISNAAFFIAAWLLWRKYRQTFVTPRLSRGDRQIFILILLLALVGLGSSLFHTFANRLTEIGDIVPIGIFTFYYLWVALRRMVGLQPRSALIALLVFISSATLLSHLSHDWPAVYKFNGSIAYFPCLAALSIIGAILYSRHHPGASCVLRAVGWFVISLTFRSLDMTLCPSFPIGTHFLWHSINGYVLYLLVAALFKAKAD